MGLLGLLAIVLLADGVILIAEGVILIAEGCAGTDIIGGLRRAQLIMLGCLAILVAAILVRKSVLGY